VVRDVLLVLLGAALGVVLTIGKNVLLDPVLARRARRKERPERWLEAAVENASEIQTHIQEVRNAATDAEHGVMSADELNQPLYALQWYEVQVGNFEDEARELLAGAH
jgi:hypothetical protein